LPLPGFVSWFWPLGMEKWKGSLMERGERGKESRKSCCWEIYGKTSIVFGKEEGEFQADINLKHTDYAGTVDGEHAVMNYSGGNWYIEDLDSENGTRIQRGGEGKQYKVSSREPCRVEKNDVIYLGLAPIKIR